MNEAKKVEMYDFTINALNAINTSSGLRFQLVEEDAHELLTSLQRALNNPKE